MRRPEARAILPLLRNLERRVDELAAAVQRAKDSFHEFVRQSWHVCEPGTQFVDGLPVQAICEHLQAVAEGKILRLAICVPPRSGKSTITAVQFPSWRWARSPETKFLFASYANSLSIRDSVRCRRLIESGWFQERYGKGFSLLPDENLKTRFTNNRMGHRISVGVDSATTGEGADIALIDDAHNASEAASTAIRESTIEWFRTTFSTRLNDQRTGRMVVIGQRVHEKDLIGFLIEQGWDTLILPAEYEGSRKPTGIGWTDPRTEPGQLLWPERVGPVEIEQLKKDLGSYGAAAQLQQRPSPLQGGIFKRHFWRFWCHAEQKLDPVLVRQPNGEFAEVAPVVLPTGQGVRDISSWDLSFKATVDGSFVAGLAARTHKANVYLLDLCKRRMDFIETIAAIKAMANKWPSINTHLLEEKANGAAAVSALKAEIGGLIPIEPQGSKIERAHAVSPLIEAGNVYLPHPAIASWVDGFIDSCASFPNADTDVVDATTQLLNWNRANGRTTNIANARIIAITSGVPWHGGIGGLTN